MRARFGMLFAMKKTIFLASLALASLSWAATLDGIAAKVNNAVITVGDVVNEMRRSRSSDDFKTAYSNAVEEVIDRRLILMAAAEKKLDMQEWLVDNRIREIVKDNFDGDMNKLNAQLAQTRTPLSDWRNQIRDDMIVNAMRFQMVEKNVTASPSAMQNEYTMHRDRYCAEAKTSVRVILLRPPQDDKTPPVTTRGEELLGRLEKGEKFADLARKHSADSHAREGGLWKDIKPEESFRPEIVTALAKLKPGEHSSLILLDGWGFIVLKESETKESQRSFAEAYEEIALNVRKDAIQRQYKSWMARLRAEAFIKIYPIPDEK